MAAILSGKEVAAAINARLLERTGALSASGVVPTLAIVRVGAREDDISYERGAMKRCQAVGINALSAVLEESASTADVVGKVAELSNDESVHGILVLRPLPKAIDDEAVRAALAPEKDVDCITDSSLAGVLSGSANAMRPCTAQACIEILDHYGIDPAGKRAAIVGRSLVVGKPLALMLTDRNATVTVCHTKTPDAARICRESDIVVAAAGRAGLLSAGYFSPGQTVVDVGINFVNGKLTGDVRFDEAEPIVGAITPVPGGVGAVTTSVLCAHVVECAERSSRKKN